MLLLQSKNAAAVFFVTRWRKKSLALCCAQACNGSLFCRITSRRTYADTIAGGETAGEAPHRRRGARLGADNRLARARRVRLETGGDRGEGQERKWA